MEPHDFLHLIGRAALDTAQDSVMSDFVLEAGPGLANAVWAAWNHQADLGHMLHDLQTLAQARPEDIEDQVDRVVHALVNGNSDAVSKSLTTYLLLVPGSIRNWLRRPSVPEGSRLPTGLELQSPRDVLRFLPPGMPRQEPGHRPSEIGDWELQDLLDLNELGETWKATNPRDPAMAPVRLQFISHPEARKFLRGPGARRLDQVLLQARHPAFTVLEQVHLYADPPCLQYEHFEGATLAGWVQEWQETGTRPDPLVVAGLIQHLAEGLGFIHNLQPPLVHGNLHAGKILVRRTGRGMEGKIAGLAMGPWKGETPSERGQHPAHDVFSLGLIWYQLLAGNLSAGRPGGSSWRRKLAEAGVGAPFIDLLESCFEDDPGQRPADGKVLAERIGELLARTAVPLAIPVVRPTSPEPGRSLKPLENSIGMKLIWIPAGSFWMGSPPGEAGRGDNEGPGRQVSIIQPFFLGVFPVTQEQFTRVMGYNPSRFNAEKSGGPLHPVESLTWEEAVEFCRRLSQFPAEIKAGRCYRLPTEAEWEYACRAGTNTLFAPGPALAAGQANFDTRFPHGHGPARDPLHRTTPVGLFPANAFDLFDMHGNVWEWCGDWLDNDYYAGAPSQDPPGPSLGQLRVLRGGSWRDPALSCRAASRHGLPPRSRDMFTGFRVVVQVKK